MQPENSNTSICFFNTASSSRGGLMQGWESELAGVGNSLNGNKKLMFKFIYSTSSKISISYFNRYWSNIQYQISISFLGDIDPIIGYKTNLKDLPAHVFTNPFDLWDSEIPNNILFEMTLYFSWTSWNSLVGPKSKAIGLGSHGHVHWVRKSWT